MREVIGLRKFSIIILIGCLFVSISIPNIKNSIPINSNIKSNLYNKIIIDAGHGGFDGGAVAPDGTLEKDINLNISMKLKELCKLGGFQVIMTREDDTGTEKDDTDTIANRKKSDMRRRLNIINENPDALFLSIHLNKFSSSAAKGSQVFYSKNNTYSQLLAESIQKRVVTLLQPDNNRLVKKADNTIFLLKNSTIPSVIVECGFLSNDDELILLKDSEYQSKMAFSIYCGILDYFKQEK